MEELTIIPIVIALVLMGFIFYIGFTSKGRSKAMKKMVESQMDMMKEMASSEKMLENLKDFSGNAINIKKSILEEHGDELKNIKTMEADIHKEAIKTTARAVKEGFTTDKTIFCKHCGAVIDADSKFCKECGKEQ